MPNKKLIDCEESIYERPHRKTKAKIVFDPSNDIIPNKKKKYSYTYIKQTAEKKIENKSKTVPRTTIGGNKLPTEKSKRVLENQVSKITEQLECLSTENDNPTSPMNWPLTHEVLELCYLCSTFSKMTELVNCLICHIKVHKRCLVTNEPVWLYKLDSNPWFCTKCKKDNCNRCLKDESQSEIAFRCASCKVGLHTNCYESYLDKPLHEIEDNLYLCVSCTDLAIQIHPIEIEGYNTATEDDDEPKPGTSGTVYAHTRSSGDESDSKSHGSLERSYDESKYPSNNIPNITEWTRAQVLGYLTERLPEHVIHQVAKHDLDGRAILLMNRSDITSPKMGLKLGGAMKFYKQVRILQTQSTHHSVYWE